jgi:hypothetical protein
MVTGPKPDHFSDQHVIRDRSVDTNATARGRTDEIRARRF